MNKAIFLAVNQATDIEKDRFSGVIGLGPRTDVSRIPTFVEQVADNMGGIGGKDPVNPIFSIYLSNSPSKTGNIIFGGYDLASNTNGKKDSDIFWANMAHAVDYFWSLPMKEP